MATPIPKPRANKLICVGSTATRVGLTFSTKHYYVRLSDFDALVSGDAPARLCALSVDAGVYRYFRPRATVAAYRALLAAHEDTQRAHMWGARQLEADQPLR